MTISIPAHGDACVFHGLLWVKDKKKKKHYKVIDIFQVPTQPDLVFECLRKSEQTRSYKNQDQHTKLKDILRNEVREYWKIYLLLYFNWMWVIHFTIK